MLDNEKLDALGQKVLGDVAGAMGAFMAYIGDQTGVYRTLAATGRTTSDNLAQRAGVDQRYLREWLSSNAACGYVDYHAEDDTFSLSPEQAAIFAVDGTTRNMQAFIQGLVAQIGAHETAVEVFRSGRGRSWSEHSGCTFCSVERGFRAMYEENLIQNWIPALDGVEARLRDGAKVADIGCGHGISAILLARNFPRSVVHGFDFHEPSIAAARSHAADAGTVNALFDVATAKDFPGQGYDLVCVFDALHDMGDPVGAALHIRETLAPGGTFMVIEPIAGDDLATNLTQLAGIYYGFSTTMCLPVSRSQEVGRCLGAQAGEKRLTEVLHEAGFTKVRRAISTDSNMVLEARA
jgi:2-polyprenyl-3-methyl-5-hydroxy-6-metoxy-1,4-benzoquinol methylase